MKKKQLLAEFIIVFFLLLLPPLLMAPVREPPAATARPLPWASLARLLIAAALQVQCARFPGARASGGTEARYGTARRFAALLEKLCWGPVTFGLLMLTYAATEALAMAFPGLFPGSAAVPAGLLPEHDGWLIALNLIAGACYEEALYRLFVPHCLTALVPPRKSFLLLAEAAAVVLFALAHRYLGALGVLNAAICGLFLRLCCRKTHGMLTGTLVHAAYNLLMVLFAAHALA